MCVCMWVCACVCVCLRDAQGTGIPQQGKFKSNYRALAVKETSDHPVQAFRQKEPWRGAGFPARNHGNHYLIPPIMWSFVISKIP